MSRESCTTFSPKKNFYHALGAFEILSIKEELIPMERGNRGHFYLTFKKARHSGISSQFFPCRSVLDIDRPIGA